MADLFCFSRGDMWTKAYTLMWCWLYMANKECTGKRTNWKHLKENLDQEHLQYTNVYKSMHTCWWSDFVSRPEIWGIELKVVCQDCVRCRIVVSANPNGKYGVLKQSLCVSIIADRGLLFLPTPKKNVGYVMNKVKYKI